MSSEWLRVMLDEIARKRIQAEEEQREIDRRSQEVVQSPAPAARSDDAAPPAPDPPA